MPADQTTSDQSLLPLKPDWIKTYKTIGNIELRCHGFNPTGFQIGEKRAGLAFFHPGGWNMGEPSWGYEWCRHCAELGLVAASFQYRLSSSGGFTPVDAITDARSAIRWIKKNAIELGIDPDKLVIAGISAGAHLALCTTMLAGPDSLNDDVTISTVPRAFILQSASVNPVASPQFLELLQGRYVPEEYSPASHVRPGLPPICFIHGTDDDLVPYTTVQEFVSAMEKAGNTCELHTFENTDHFFRNKQSQLGTLKAIDTFLLNLGLLMRRQTNCPTRRDSRKQQ
jgi:acetyl esterase